MEDFNYTLIILILILSSIISFQYQTIKKIKSYEEYWHGRYLKMREDYFKAVDQIMGK